MYMTDGNYDYRVWLGWAVACGHGDEWYHDNDDDHHDDALLSISLSLSIISSWTKTRQKSDTQK